MSACICSHNSFFAPPPMEIISLMTLPFSRKISTDSLSENVIPSKTARTKCFRSCELSIPIKLPRMDASTCGVRSPSMYGVNNNPFDPTGTLSTSLNRSSKLSFLANVFLNHVKLWPAAKVTPIE